MIKKLPINKILSLIFCFLFVSFVIIGTNLSLRLSAATAPTISSVFLKSDGFDAANSNTWTPVVPGDGSTAGQYLGEDSSDSNGVVKLGDSITYKVENSANELGACNHTVTLTVDANQFITALPAKCLTVAPSGYSTNCPTFSTVSSISSDGRTLICNMGYTDEATLNVLQVPVVVKSTAGNNRYVSASAQVSADGANTVSLPTLQTLTTADFKLDLVKANVVDSGWVDGSGPAGETGRFVTFATSLVLRKGSELPNTNSFHFVDTYSYSTLTATSHALLYNWNGNVPCGVNAGEVADLPFAQAGIAPNATVTNSLSQLANVNCSNPVNNANSLSFDIDITNADTSLATIPSKNVDNSSILTGNTVIYAGW